MNSARQSACYNFRTARVCATVLLITGLVATLSAHAQTFQVLHSFGFGTDGAYPTGSLIEDSAGIFYGTTFYGGAFGGGTVFSMDSTGKERVLYSFTGGSDGGHPWSGLVLDSAGNLYGTATFGAAFNAGTVFRLSKNGKFTTLYTFTGGADGANPRAGLARDSAGNLYGVTENGGDNSLTCYGFTGCGVVFEVDSHGNEITLHTFTMGIDGGFPYSTLTIDAAGNLYGTTEYGGASGSGIVFKIDPAGNETILHSFAWYNGVDGGIPIGGLVLDAEGNVYGTTSLGGSPTACQTFGCGIVFELSPSGNESILYDFNDPPDAGDCWGTLVRDPEGNLWGTSYAAGRYGFGALFKVVASGKERVMHNFTGGSDGGYVTAPLFRDGSGNLYGTANGGGQAEGGTLFVMKP